MPPQKRSTDDSDSARKPDKATAATKRRRVSLACDACRTAREKCDGGRPNCGRCVSQNRPCSYTPTSKKRGIQSGYLRAIELSLAWLLERVPDNEEALFQLLVKDDGKDGASILMSKGKSASRLHKQWSKCRIHKEIESLLCQGRPQKMEASNTEDSDTDDDIGSQPTLVMRQPLSSYNLESVGAFEQAFSPKEPKSVKQRALLRLPSNYSHLLDIYFAYTHCWFPILDRDEILATAALCDSRSENIPSYKEESNIAPSSLAVLWSAMAVAAFQDAHSSAPRMSEAEISPIDVFNVARSLIPQEEDNVDIAGVQAILLQTIIFIGRGNMLAASLIAGKAMRLIAYLQSSRLCQTHVDMQRLSLKKLAAACNLVEALTSICIGQASNLLDIENLNSTDLPQDGPGFGDSFSPTYGFGKLSLNPEPVRPQVANPLLALDQLGRFARILSTHTAGKLQRNGPANAVTVGDLVSSLNPQFSFCNSVIAEEATPRLPSAFLAQAMFLAATIELVPGQRPSLTSNFLEVVESSISNFGACGTPPIIIALFLLVQQKGIMDEMRTSEANRWNSALHKIKTVWSQDEITKSAVCVSPKTSTTNNSWGEIVSLEPLGRDSAIGQHNEDHQESRTGSFNQGYGLFPADVHMSAGNQVHTTNQHKYSPAHLPTNLGMLFLPPSIGPMQPIGGVLQAGEPHTDSVDYDAILEELGNIDYADSIDMDPQFMMNLGFAPGCTLEEMFHAEPGI
ncbi:quinic acid utilization activator [Trichoderma arundinaceum]|uniref:Quinic acid utilization activator n=1 Tax=Trichoderma arundinaceum TaxID=490622 RepID=A0A395NQC1_TRIAR|nr:quinic acid utilization activator [Trichoderma arundinaceum]